MKLFLIVFACVLGYIAADTCYCGLYIQHVELFPFPVGPLFIWPNETEVVCEDEGTIDCRYHCLQNTRFYEDSPSFTLGSPMPGQSITIGQFLCNSVQAIEGESYEYVDNSPVDVFSQIGQAPDPCDPFTYTSTSRTHVLCCSEEGTWYDCDAPPKH